MEALGLDRGHKYFVPPSTYTRRHRTAVTPTLAAGCGRTALCSPPPPLARDPLSSMTLLSPAPSPVLESWDQVCFSCSLSHPWDPSTCMQTPFTLVAHSHRALFVVTGTLRVTEKPSPGGGRRLPFLRASWEQALHTHCLARCYHQPCDIGTQTSIFQMRKAGWGSDGDPTEMKCPW